MSQTINATQVRESFSEIINRVVYGGEEFVVERQGKPVIRITTVVGKAGERTQKVSPLKFLIRLSRYGLRSAPDLAKNHDKYTWK